MINRKTSAMIVTQMFEIFEMFSERSKTNNAIILGIMIDDSMLTKNIKSRTRMKSTACAMSTHKFNMLITISSRNDACE